MQRHICQSENVIRAVTLNKAQKRNLRDDALRFALSDDSLDVLASSSTGPHAMGNGTWQGSEVAEVRINVDRVIVA